MFTEPASNVSVPLTVVMRNLSNVPPRANVPDATVVLLPSDDSAVTLAAIQLVLVMLSSVTMPVCDCVALLMPATAINPAVDVTPAVLDAEAWEARPPLTYPDVVTLPAPICTKKFDVPLVETPLNITVIRLIQLGSAVKSMLVPLVDVTAVDNVFMELVAVPACKVSVLDPATAGAATVTVPLVSPEITTDDIYFLYKTTQRAPVGTVTATPLASVIGPVDIALKPVVRV